MQNENGLTPLERELEAALGGLTPTGAGLSRDRIMFAAGQAAIQRKNRLWQGISSGLAVLLMVSILSRPEPTPIKLHPEIVATAAVGASSAALTMAEEDRGEAFGQYVRTRRAVLERGLDVLPASKPTRKPMGEPPLTRENLSELLSST